MIDVRITHIERITHNSVALTLEPLQSDVRVFKPGQYLTLETRIEGQSVRRSYSLCVPPSAGRWQVGIKEVPDGSFSTWANRQAKVGDQLKALAPDGKFTIPDQDIKSALMIAAGSGITPMLSNIEAALESNPDIKITLLYSNRNTGSVMFRKRIGDLKDRYLNRLRVLHVFSREDGGSDLLSGRLDKDRLEKIFRNLWLEGTPDVVMICGPLEMTQAAQTVLTDLGMPKTSVLTELFGTPLPTSTRLPKTHRVREGAVAFVTVDEVTTQVDLSQADVSILDAGLAAGLDLPYACKGGVCSTCRAKVTEGQFHMANNYALEEYEIEQGYVLSCQCFPDSEVIKLDFDQ